jgi:predicted DCC family thiol-disulfide oxidoreductase YuxK
MDDLSELGERLLVIFDGHCGLCNRSVRWFLIRDQRDHLRFVPSESPRVAALLARHGISSSSGVSTPNTILVVRDPERPAEQLLVRSEGVLAMLSELPRLWPAVARVLRWIPRPLLDLGYRLIARSRYRIWGRLESCPLPTLAERARFL